MTDFMKRASEAYYAGTPVISNEEYDALERIHGQIISGTGNIPHPYRMYSLYKHYEARDGALTLQGIWEDTPKYDGAAVSIVYIGGELAFALTRGDGIKGNDITSKIKLLDVPNRFDSHSGVVQITGEVVADKRMPNSRNYASGALNLKSDEEFLQRKTDGSMRFIAYNIQVEQNLWGLFHSYTEDLLNLQEQGFDTVLQDYTDLYPTDGVVYRRDSNDDFNEAGFTDKFPRGALALKEEQESVETTLLDVIWQTGKSGKVTPVAILEPVVIGEATIARATLNNLAYIEGLNLELGCTVLLIRSGEIIPKIIGRI